MLERRPKRKGKGKLSATPKGRKPATTFQKKLVVVDYMGSKAPRSFGLKESYVLIRGMLPEISIEADEMEVREIIISTIRDSEKTLVGFSGTNFEFLEANGKCLCVPAQHSNFQWTGRAVKQLSGSGAIYIRLTMAREESDISDFTCSDSSETAEPDVKIIKVEKSGEWIVSLSTCVCVD